MNEMLTYQISEIINQFEAGKYEQGIQQLSELYENTPYIEEKIDILHIYIELGLINEAKEHIVELEEQGDLYELDRLRAEISYKEGNFDEALAIMHEVLEYMPRAEDYVFASHIYFDQGLPEVASRYINLAIEEQEGVAYYYYLKGLYAFENGSFEEAVTSFEEAVIIEEEEPLYFLGLGQAHYSLGNFEEALDNLNKVLRLYPNQEETLYLKSVILIQMGFVEEGIESLEQLIELHPENFEISLALSDAYEAAQQPEKSIAILENILKMDEFHLEAIKRLIDSYMRQENYIQAEKYIKLAIQLDPEDDKLKKLIEKSKA